MSDHRGISVRRVDARCAFAMVAHRLTALVALLAVPSHALLPPLAARAPVHLRPSKVPRLAPVKLTSEEEAADAPAAPSVGLIARRLPILTWAPKLTSARIIGDIIAGLTVATVLIPQGMSYATVAGLNPIVGLYRHVLTRTGSRTSRLRAARTKGTGQLAPWRHGCPCCQRAWLAPGRT